MLRKCRGNWECQNPNCIFLEISGGIRNKYRISDGICEECNKSAVPIKCSALKATKLNDRKDAITKIWYFTIYIVYMCYLIVCNRIYYDGEHTCTPPSIPDISNIVNQKILHNTHIYPQQSM